MDKLSAFRASLDESAPPDGPAALQGLWWLGKGDWDRAHQIAQDHEGDPACDWLHAHLHRVEGDAGNARYWYRRAGVPEAAIGFEAEFAAMACALLATD